MTCVAVRRDSWMADRRISRSETPGSAGCFLQPVGVAGFTYFGVLFLILMMSLAASAAGTLWSTTAQRQREAQLIWTGEQFRLAIRRYYLDGFAGARAMPRSLDDLLEDRRSSPAARHLRRIYVDPMTGTTDWEVLTTADGSLIGVASRSQDKPLKKGNFSVENEFFEEAERYTDWRFVFLPQTSLDRP